MNNIEKMSEEDKIINFSANLQPTIQAQVRFRHPTTLYDAIRLAQDYNLNVLQVEDHSTHQLNYTQRRGVSRKNFKPNRYNTQNNNNHNRNQNNNNNQNNEARNNRNNFNNRQNSSGKPRKNIRCNKCQKMGHYAKQCFSKLIHRILLNRVVTKKLLIQHL